MSEYFYGSIQIGGKVKLSDFLQHVLNEIDEEFDILSESNIDNKDPNDGPIDQENEHQDIDTLMYKLKKRSQDPGSPTLDFEGQEARNGCFEGLENTLVTLGIPFIRYSSQYYEFREERVCFDGKTYKSTFLDGDGSAYIPMNELEEILTKADKASNRDALKILLLSAIQETREIKLPPFQLVP